MNEVRTAYLSLGSNLGDREGLLREAVRLIEKAEGVKLLSLSSVYQTEPWGKTDQPRFLNMAAAIETELSPERLLALTQSVENALGRVRHEHWGARTIDVDILYIDGTERHTPTLTLPHPYMTERAFVLVPLAEIAPGLAVGGRTISEWRALLGSKETAAVMRKAWRI